ncbi:MAG: zinc finger domain-containing protein, partial [Chthoniobacterales bacterium]
GYVAPNDSIHLRLFPETQGNLRDQKLREQFGELLKLRGIIGQAIEKARQERLIGNALEAAVVLRCDEGFVSDFPRAELEEFFILSDLKLEPAEEASAVVSLTPNKKCARCWRHREAVGTIARYPDLCDRCAAVVEPRA